jgi:uncharacterized membrane protein YfcA
MAFTFEALLATALCFLAAGLMKGLTGLGFLTVCVVSLTLIVGLKTAVALVLVPSLLSNLFIMVDVGRFLQTTRSFWRLYLASAPGVVVGVQLLIVIDQDLAAAILGSVVVAYTVLALAKPTVPLPDGLRRALQVPVGLAHGIVAGLTGSQLMPLFPYLFALKLESATLLQTCNTIFTLCSLLTAALLFNGGLLTPEIGLLSLAGTMPTLLGVLVGSGLRRRLSVESFRIIVLCVILALGLVLMARALKLA